VKAIACLRIFYEDGRQGKEMNGGWDAWKELKK
jgi:hypothetical protein